MMQISGWCLATALLLTGGPVCAQVPNDSLWVRRDTMIAMRDGVRLKTFLVQPARASGPLPILLMRTPYGAAGSAQNFPGAYRFLVNDGYIFAFQDIRGRGQSEGQYLMNRPLRTDSSGVDEATDTYDTIEWLLRNVPGNNGGWAGSACPTPDGWRRCKP